MDFTLPALKLLIGDLAKSTMISDSVCSIGNHRFQRAWIQGVVVTVEETVLLDDGSGIIELNFPREKLKEKRLMKNGMYMLIVGGYQPAENAILVHKHVNLSSAPDREALWNLEVIEAYNLFYKN